ncbi:MAG: response regulator transcription factor [Caldilineaceae bacterium]|nr:response regulator transcription factor [Caldilineaceae bacterium]
MMMKRDCHCNLLGSLLAQTRERMENDGPFHRQYWSKQVRNQLAILEARLQLATLADGQERYPEQIGQTHWQQPTARSSTVDTYQDSFSPAPPARNSLGSSARLAWVQRNLQPLPKAVSLRTRFATTGMEVSVHQWQLEDIGPVECDLILFDSCTMTEQEMVRFLFKIRLFTQTPLIILTDNYTLDWAVSALRAGADAIFTINMPDDVILARSNALLRRWIAGQA